MATDSSGMAVLRRKTAAGYEYLTVRNGDRHYDGPVWRDWPGSDDHSGSGLPDMLDPAPIRATANHTLAILLPMLIVSSILLFSIFVFSIVLLHRRRRGIELSEEGGPTSLEREDQVEGEGGLDGVESRWLQTVDEPTKMGYVRAKIWQTQYPPDSQPTEITLSQFLSIQEKGVSAWSFEPDYESNPALIVESRTEITFLADGAGMAPEEGGGCSVQSNLPVPKLNDVYYFECKMYEKAPTTNVSVGLATKPYPSFRMPGVSRYSVGYHSEDGFKSHSFPFTATSYGPPLLEGDTLGVGYRPRTGTVFFTRNGKKLEDAYVGFNKRNVFPTIGADGPCSVHVNLGQAGFVFIEANVKKWGLAPMMGTLAPPPAYGSERGSILLESAATSSGGGVSAESAAAAPRSSRHRRTSSLNAHHRTSSAAAAAALSSPTQPIRPSPLRHAHARHSSSASTASGDSSRRARHSAGDAGGSDGEDGGNVNPPTPGLLDISLHSMHRFPDRIHESDEDEDDAGEDQGARTPPSDVPSDVEESEPQDASPEESEQERLLSESVGDSAGNDGASAESASPPGYHPIDPNMYAPGVAETILEDVLGRRGSARAANAAAASPSSAASGNPQQAALHAFLAQQRRAQHLTLNDLLSRPLLTPSGRSTPSFGSGGGYEARTDDAHGPARGSSNVATAESSTSFWGWLTGRSRAHGLSPSGVDAQQDAASRAEQGRPASPPPPFSPSN